MKKSIRPLLFCAAVVLTLSGYELSAAESESEATHPKVLEALAWRLPENPCTQPKAPGKSKEVRDETGVMRTEWDVDSYTLERYERKEKRWKKCVAKYKQELSFEKEKLKNSAQYGLTEQQAITILGKMKLIQDVLLSPQGTLP